VGEAMIDAIKIFFAYNVPIVIVLALFYGLVKFCGYIGVSPLWSVLILLPYAAWLRWIFREECDV
jgi:hypothetical protein